MNYLKEISGTWVSLIKDKNRMYFYLIVIVFAIITFTIFPKFLLYVESRVGIIIPDPFFAFKPIDLTYPIFSVIYTCILIALVYTINRPAVLFRGLLAYSIMLLFRMLAMYSLPLEPPPSMIELRDPFVELLSSGTVLTKDLFFSGHTSTMFMLVLIVQSKTLRVIFLSGTLFIALGVILQHVHYSVDVIAAPFFALGALSLAQALENFFGIIKPAR